MRFQAHLPGGCRQLREIPSQVSTLQGRARRSPIRWCEQTPGSRSKAQKHHTGDKIPLDRSSSLSKIWEIIHALTRPTKFYRVPRGLKAFRSSERRQMRQVWPQLIGLVVGAVLVSAPTMSAAQPEKRASVSGDVDQQETNESSSCADSFLKDLSEGNTCLVGAHAPVTVDLRLWGKFRDKKAGTFRGVEDGSTVDRRDPEHSKPRRSVPDSLAVTTLDIPEGPQPMCVERPSQCETDLPAPVLPSTSTKIMADRSGEISSMPAIEFDIETEAWAPPRVLPQSGINPVLLRPPRSIAI